MIYVTSPRTGNNRQIVTQLSSSVNVNGPSYNLS